MNLKDDNVREVLAAEYVLGTLTEPARKRFERYCETDHDLRARVSFWEDSLVDAALTRAPLEEPSGTLLNRIETSLGWTTDSATKESEKSSGGWRSWLLLLGSGVAAACLALFVAPVIWWQAEHQAVISTEQAQSLWEVELSVSQSKVRVASLGYPPPVGRSDYELWWLPKEGDPVSLGVLPRLVGDSVEYQLDELPKLGKGFAVSVEPRGGSTTGAPTGPVVFVQLLEA